MEEAIQANGMAMAAGAARGGSSFWMRAEGVDTRELADRLLRRGVLIEPGAVFFGTQRPNSDHYRLAYSSIPAARIREGIALVAEEIGRSGVMQ